MLIEEASWSLRIVMLSSSNTVEPADVVPFSFQVTMRPVSSRFGKSVAVTLIEKLRLIALASFPSSDHFLI
jgi:hypothetical protein